MGALGLDVPLPQPSAEPHPRGGGSVPRGYGIARRKSTEHPAAPAVPSFDVDAHELKLGLPSSEKIRT